MVSFLNKGVKMNNLLYFPIIKWKAGEYNALSHLSDCEKEVICPIIELTSVDYDFEERKPKRTLEDHLEKIGDRLYKKWGNNPALIDVNNIDCSSNKDFYITKIFKLYRKSGCHVVPVINFNELLLNVYGDIIHHDLLGVAIRLKRQDLANPNFQEKLNNLITILGVSADKVDLIIDLERLVLLNNDETKTYNYIYNKLSIIPNINSWRSLIIAGSTFPEDVVLDESQKRYEWSLYQNIVKRTKNERVFAFSDYTVFPNGHTEPMDMRKIAPKAKFRYTNDNFWYFWKGKITRGEKGEAFADQLREQSKRFINTNMARNKEFSYGDEYIHLGALGEIKGNATTWITAFVNQHICKVVYDLSKMYDVSMFHELFSLVP